MGARTFLQTIFSGLTLIGTIIFIAFQHNSHVMSGAEVEKWLLVGCVFFSALFCLVGVRNKLVNKCRDGLTFYLVAYVLFFNQYTAWILKSEHYFSSMLRLFPYFLYFIFSMASVAGLMMELREAHPPGKALKRSNQQKVADISQSLTAPFKKAT